jgi:hypothetical protein
MEKGHELRALSLWQSQYPADEIKGDSWTALCLQFGKRAGLESAEPALQRNNDATVVPEVMGLIGLERSGHENLWHYGCCGAKRFGRAALEQLLHGVTPGRRWVAAGIAF